ncbi:late expression factor 1 [Malacosoma neustria nucleopolyhedrovirus]|uniref:late expression factor 1 n=1 Tax=Malacosoma neustria nuclear polyhedrosis virus TaxID=38012 RepID=UPI000E35FD70|nr:late expression factor 1 [Malacosoma neustria nucleopolyhedrovirus]AUF81655.1 late expression factor 1 [Malacosoma neustria nucleopolyhedrovirus]
MNNMAARKQLYSENNALLMWNSVAFNDSRKYSFFNGRRWYHPPTPFDSFNDFYDFINKHDISDVHVKSLEDNMGREWVIDVDFDKNICAQLLDLKIAVANVTFLNFFGSDNVARIMHSGNRGLHVWLKINKFRMSASQQHREKYFKTFIAPCGAIDLADIRPGSFIDALNRAIDDKNIEPMIRRYYNAKTDRQAIIKSLWPLVDRQVFCHVTHQIRAPFSYNFKGQNFSHQLH